MGIAEVREEEKEEVKLLERNSEETLLCRYYFTNSNISMK